jgi:hypothetical protein
MASYCFMIKVLIASGRLGKLSRLILEIDIVSFDEDPCVVFLSSLDIIVFGTLLFGFSYKVSV